MSKAVEHILFGQTIDGKAAANWPLLFKLCAKFEKFKIAITDKDAETTSTQMMRWWHGFPVRLYAEYTGLSEWQAEQYLKRECGESVFVRDYDDAEAENKNGQAMFECLYRHCRHLFIMPKKNDEGKFCCPKCGSDIKVFFMMSKTEVSIQDFCKVMENAHDFLSHININCPMPDTEWSRNNDGKREKKTN